MTDQVKTGLNEPEESKDKYLSLKLLGAVALAFCAGLVFRRSMGIIAMTPLAFLFCLAAAFIKIDPKLKLAVFGTTVFVLNTIEQQDITVTLIHTALCLLACLAFEYAASKLNSKKKLSASLFASGIILCTALSFFLVGNPFTALKVDKTFDEHIEANYKNSEDALLGRFEFTRIYYNYRTKAYAVSGVSSKYPTERAELTFGGNVLTDGFSGLMEEKLSESYVLEMTVLLRKLFPDDSFTVEYDSVARMPGESMFSSAKGELNGSMNYIITLSGIQGAKEMREVTQKYLNAIDKSGIGYSRLIFRSGIGFWSRRSITVEGDHFIGHADLKLERAKIGASTEFNRFLTQRFSEKMPKI